MINFYIPSFNRTFTVASGTTWGEWIGGGESPAYFWINTDGSVMMNDGTAMYIQYNSANVYSTDVIISERSYDTLSEGPI